MQVMTITKTAIVSLDSQQLVESGSIYRARFAAEVVSSKQHSRSEEGSRLCMRYCTLGDALLEINFLGSITLLWSRRTFVCVFIARWIAPRNASYISSRSEEDMRGLWFTVEHLSIHMPYLLFGYYLQGFTPCEDTSIHSETVDGQSYVYSPKV